MIKLPESYGFLRLGWHSDGMLLIDGYKVIHNDRSDVRRGCGVGLLIKDDL